MFGCFEDTVKGGQTSEAGTHRHLRNGDIRLHQQRFRMSDPFLHQVFVAGYAGELLEQSRKMKFGETGKTGEVIHIYIFGTVTGTQRQYKLRRHRNKMRKAS